MVNTFDFEHNFGKYAPPDELVQLLNFENKQQHLSNGFYLFEEGRFSIQYLSMEEGFLNQLMPFGMGSPIAVYALWDDVTGKKLNTMPVVVLGNDGGIHVVAEDILIFMQLLTYDTPISVDVEKAWFYKDSHTHVKSLHHDAYTQWLKKTFLLNNIDEPATIIKAAQDKYKTAFDIWLGKYLSL